MKFLREDLMKGGTLSKINEYVGLKVGLEIHCQLHTVNKLFCKCQTKLSDKPPTLTYIRRLRPTQSELGQVDPAAMFEFQKGRAILYETDAETSCLVEMDEEPPHDLNSEAVDVGLAISMMLNSKPVDEIHVMRKIVIDGSNTTGFQRTCVVALGGMLNVDGREIPIQHVSLEEDAARKTGESGMTVNYRIDRLGIPLVEIATAPVIRSPSETEKVAYAIGRILKATKKVKRGLGTIRQDLNISLEGGALIEIKGVQKLDILARVVEYEISRQITLLKIRDELRSRGLREDELKGEFFDVSHVFQETSCGVIKSSLSKGGRVLASVLPKFRGLLAAELEPNLRLGTEMAHRAMFWGRVGGIFHTDELPSYGIALREVEALLRNLGAKNEDLVVLVADYPENAEDALKAVVERAREALKGVPEETRGPNPDGTTRYMRPRPGAARMYPETDVPPVPVSQERITRIKAQLPPMPDVLVKELMDSYNLNRKLAEQLMDSDYLPLFETILSKTKIPASFVATTLTEVIKSLGRQGIDVEALPESRIEEAFLAVDSGMVAKEAIADILTWISKNQHASISQAIEKLGLKMLSNEELSSLVEKYVREQISMVKQQRHKAFGRLMNMIMGEVRGRADAKLIGELLKSKLEEAMAKE
jgi:glutamyl-tRNA(Gln) amidotransferase subunit E